MRGMNIRRAVILVLVSLPLALAVMPSVPAAPGAPAEVTLAVVKYGQLAEAVQARRGSVVVVDAWGTFCPPCRREFPNLVRLHERYAKDGLVCMSVSVDPVDRREAALEFLKVQRATFPNFLLDEPGEVWQQRWHTDSVPVVFVFDREGRRAAKFDDHDPNKPLHYADVETLVRELLRAPR